MTVEQSRDPGRGGRRRCGPSCRRSPSAPSPRSSSRSPATPTRSPATWAGHRERRRAGAGRLPRAGDGEQRRRREHADPAGAGGRLRAGPGRGAQRPLDGRPARRLPGGRAGLLAAHERERRGGRPDRRAARPVRRAGVRLHRPAVGRERGRAQRRAGDQRPGPAALPGAPGRRLLAGAPAGAGGRRGAGRLGAAAHADRGRPPGGERPRGAGLRSTAARCAPGRTCPVSTPTELVVLLVPDADGPVAAGAAALAGRARRRRRPGPPVDGGAASYARACRACGSGCRRRVDGPLDTERRLADLVLRADGEALADLRAGCWRRSTTCRPARGRS